MNNEHVELNNILLERDMEGNPNSTEDIFNSIVKYTSLYGVDTNDLRDFYNFWWFDRHEDLNSIIENNEINMEVIKELVSSSEIKLSKIIGKLSDEVSELKDLISESKEDYQSKINKTKDDLNKLRESVDEEKVKLENTISNTLSGKITDIEAKIKETVSTETVVEKVVDDGLKEKIEANRISINKINNSFIELKSSFEDMHKPIVSQNGKTKNRLIEVDKIFKRLQLFFKQADKSFSSATTIGSVINSFGAFYVESESVIDLLFKEFATEGATREIVVDPTFVSIESLKEIKFDELDMIVFKNISAGFIEGYLIPILIQGNSSLSSFPKVVVLQDEKIDERINSEILKHTLYLSIEFLQGVMSAEPLNKDVKDLIDINSRSAISEEHDDLLKILENSGVKIPNEVSDKLALISEIMKKYLKDAEILSLSTSAVVYPYMRKKYGSVKSETVTEVLKGIA